MPTNAGGKPVTQERAATDRRHEDLQPAGNLTVHYGAIGIPAVAAALRYTVATKNLAYAPVVSRPEPKWLESAAA